MTPGNNGASTPEDDDPFGYLYEDGQATGATPPRSGGYGYPGPAQPGVPRTSYNQVRTVGERQYGQQQAAQAPQQAAYAAPETLPGYQPAARTAQGHAGSGRGGGRGPNTKGLLIGAVAVVAAVVIGIVAALSSDDDSQDKDSQANGSANGGTSQSETADPSPTSEGKDEEKPAELPESDAAKLNLTGGAAAGNSFEGARSGDGSYVTFPAVGAAAEWTIDVPKDGAYTLFVYYSVPGKDADTTLTVNGQSRTDGVSMKNHAKAEEGAWDKGWTYTYNYLDLNKGTNSLKISCETGNQCEAAVDRVKLVEGQVSKG
ncbi:carbohydrate-binding protein [Streptomyces sp. GC420]|uniref:carbohydrate-binding protein n=1 Tax=Streptomyces sp. GC420 TaxID=2697568 RepID=UPI001414D2D9|nr:carbohydrate-binding protein [Streptomyces sp. GC420]NBM16745.1 carbohydrate-binding protein [Streptomyces sp. GC420]